MRIQKRFAGQTGLSAILMALPQFAAAYAFCPSAVTGGGVALCQFIEDHIIVQAMVAFWGVAAVFITYYAARLVIEAYEEKTMSETIVTFIQVFIGFVVIALAAAFANSFAFSLTPINLGPGIASVASFIITAASGVFVLMVVIAGMRMITTQGDQGAFQKWTKVLVYNCIGVVIMFVAYFIVHAVSDIDPGLLVEEMRGLVLFLLTIIGFACVAALIIAGIFLIISIDESYRDRAKKIVIGTLITLAIVIIIYTLIYFFVIVT